MVSDCGLAWMCLGMYTSCLSARGCCSQQQSPGGWISYRTRKTRNMSEFQEVSWAGTRRRSLLLPHTTMTHSPQRTLRHAYSLTGFPQIPSHPRLHLSPPVSSDRNTTNTQGYNCQALGLLFPTSPRLGSWSLFKQRPPSVSTGHILPLTSFGLCTGCPPGSGDLLALAGSAHGSTSTLDRPVHLLLDFAPAKGQREEAAHAPPVHQPVALVLALLAGAVGAGGAPVAVPPVAQLLSLVA